MRTTGIGMESLRFRMHTPHTIKQKLPADYRCYCKNKATDSEDEQKRAFYNIFFQ